MTLKAPRAAGKPLCPGGEIWLCQERCLVCGVASELQTAKPEGEGS